MTQPCPKARSQDVLVQEVGEEIVVYDVLTHQCHALNPMVAAVWKYADGTRPVEEIGALVAAAHGVGPASDATALALDELREAGLLEAQAPPSFDRRAALRRLVAAGLAASALPAITSLAAPSSAMAQSPGAPAVTCVPDSRLFDGDSPTEQEVLAGLNAQALTYAEFIAASHGGTYVSHSVRGPSASLVGSYPEPHWFGTIVVTGVCYSMP